MNKEKDTGFLGYQSIDTFFGLLPDFRVLLGELKLEVYAFYRSCSSL